MPRPPRRLPFVLALASAAGAADTLSPVVVTAARTEGPLAAVPMPIAVVSRDEIEAAAAPALSDLMRSRAGIQARDLFGDGSSAVLDLRGFGAAAGANTLLLVDGRPLNNASDLSDPDLNAVGLFDVERVEVVQGSAGVLYGNQAVGGLVNLVPRVPTGTEAVGSAALGSWGGWAAHGRLGTLLDGGAALGGFARFAGSDGYRDHNATRRDGVRLRTDAPAGDGTAYLEAQALRERQQTPGSLFADEVAANRRQSAPIYRDDYSDTDTGVVRAGLRQPLGALWRLEADAAWRRNARDFVQSFRFQGAPGTRSTQDRTVWTVAPRLQGRVPLAGRETEVTLGVDWEQTDYALRTAFGPQGVDQTVWGVYGQATVPVGDDVAATLGARRAGVRNALSDGAGSADLDDALTVGTAGLSWQASADLRLFLRADQNFRFAKVDEYTNVVFGTPVGLRTQRGTSWEGGARYLAPQRRLEAVLYQLDLEDEISFDSSGYANVNLDATRRRGLILVGEWAPARGVTLGADYAYTGNEVTAGPFAGNRIPLVAEQSGRVWAGWAPRQDAALQIEGVFVGRRALGGDFENAFPDLPYYGIANLSGSLVRSGWRAVLRVSNLFDRRYSEVGAVGLDADFARRDAYFPSPERTVWLTVSYVARAP
jgi:iron complex outermembrane receptor protein